MTTACRGRSSSGSTIGTAPSPSPRSRPEVTRPTMPRKATGNRRLREIRTSWPLGTREPHWANVRREAARPAHLGRARRRRSMAMSNCPVHRRFGPDRKRAAGQCHLSRRPGQYSLTTGGPLNQSPAHAAMDVCIGRAATQSRKTMVLLPLARTRPSRCQATARASTRRSISRPLRTRSSGVSLCEMRSTSCSMIGPSSRSAVT